MKRLIMAMALGSIVSSQLFDPALVNGALPAAASSAAAALPQTSRVTPESAVLLERVLTQLATLAGNFAQNLPDFIAQEVLIQEDYNGKGKLVERSETVSRLTGQQLRLTQGAQLELTFKETRQILTINGKTAKTDDLRTRGAQVGGTFAAMLAAHFAERDQQDYYFEIDPQPTFLQGQRVYVLSFFSRLDSNRQYYRFEGQRYLSQQRGKAWVMADNYSLLRLEYWELNLPQGITRLSYTVDYAPVVLGEEKFVLPITAITEIYEKKDRSRVVVNYSDYKKFSTDVKVD
jgi:hypothetical protein